MIHLTDAGVDLTTSTVARQEIGVGQAGSLHASVPMTVVAVPDGYESDIDDRMEVQARFAELEAYLQSTGDSLVGRADNIIYQSPAMRAWRALMPSAKALYPLQRPNTDCLPDAMSTPIDEQAQKIFRHSLDAIGIRTRAKIMKAIAVEHTIRGAAPSVRWLSLACGAAVPVLDAIETLREQTNADYTVHLTLVDSDPDALAFAEHLVAAQADAGPDQVEVLRRNLITELIRSDRLITELQGQNPHGFDIIDMLGIFEYFPDSLAAKLLANAMRLTKPGGQVIIANMLDTHPNLAVNQRAVGWPGIKPRSAEEVLRIAHSAGITNAQLEAFHATDGVYLVLSIARP